MGVLGVAVVTALWYNGCAEGTKPQGCFSCPQSGKAVFLQQAHPPERGLAIMPRPTPQERFWSKVKKTETCWLWVGSYDGDGYGMFGVTHRRTSRAHRVAYEFLVGPIPLDLELDHLCRNPGCVNPVHLEAVPHRINVLRGNGLTAQHAAKTHCPQGHPYDLFNTYAKIGRRGRECRQCRQDRDAIRQR